MPTYKEQAEALQERVGELTSKNDTLENELASTSRDLAAAKTEIENLTAKVASVPSDVVAAYETLKAKVAADKAALEILHPILVACTRLKPCRTVDDLKHNMQKFRDVIGAEEAYEREKKWR